MMGAESSAPRTVTRPAGRQDHGTTYTRHCITARDRARLIVALDGQHWIVSDDPAAETELRKLAERLTGVLVASVGGAS
jgi:hypothetical protein